jgi:L-lactate dehydrogenase complex protein LldG
MSSARGAFLQQVRAAVTAGNQVGRGARPQPRGNIAYQGDGDDIVQRFTTELEMAGGHGYRVSTRDELGPRIIEILRRFSPRTVLVGSGGILDSLLLAGLPSKIVRLDGLSPDECKARCFQADAGISRVDYLIAASGTIVIKTAADHPRSLSLLPPIHIAVAERSQLVPDLFDVFEAEQPGTGVTPPSCLTFITGPSKTGDIELKLVTGVHGPGELHVVLLDV